MHSACFAVFLICQLMKEPMHCAWVMDWVKLHCLERWTWIHRWPIVWWGGSACTSLAGQTFVEKERVVTMKRFSWRKNIWSLWKGFCGMEEFKPWRHGKGHKERTQSECLYSWSTMLVISKKRLCIVFVVHLWLSRICSSQICSCSRLKSTDHVMNVEGKCNYYKFCILIGVPTFWRYPQSLCKVIWLIPPMPHECLAHETSWTLSFGLYQSTFGYNVTIPHFVN